MALNQSLTAALSRGYYPHSLKQIPSKGNQWYVIITKPEALRENKKNIQVRRSTGTTDYKYAKQLEIDIVAKVYAEFDALLKRDPFLELVEQYWIISDKTEHLSASDYTEKWGKVQTCIMVWFAISKDRMALDGEDFEGRGFKDQRINQLFEYLDFQEASEFRSVVTPAPDPYPMQQQTAKAATLRTFIADLDGVDLSDRSTKIDLSSEVINRTGCPTILEYLPRYLADKKWERTSKKSKGEIEFRIKCCASIIGDLPLDQIFTAHGLSIAKHLDQQNKANSTIKTYVNNLSVMLTHAISNILDDSRNPPQPFVQVNHLKNISVSDYGKTGRSWEALEEAQLYRLFAQEMPVQDRLLLSILVTTGMRLDEAALLTWEQLKIDKHGIRYFDLSMGKTKNDRFSRRNVAIPDCLTLPDKGTGRLFNLSLNKDGKASSKASKDLNRNYLHPIRFNSDDDRKVVHSLRHNLVGFLLNLENPAPSSEHMDWITGHGMEGSKTESTRQKTYAKDPDVSVKYNIVNRVKHPWLKQL